METLFAVKAVMFIATETFVVSVVLAVLITGLYEIIRDKVQEARRNDGVVATSLPPA